VTARADTGMMLDPLVPLPARSPDLSELTIRDLAALSGGCLSELRRRGAVRTGNAPVGDLAELLVAHSVGGTLAPPSQKSWDVLGPDGAKIQVKARVVHDERNPGERQLSAFRSWNFDHAVVVLFDPEFRVRNAAKLDRETLQQHSGWVGFVNAARVMATDRLLQLGAPWTARLNDPALWRELETMPIPTSVTLSAVTRIPKGTRCASKIEFERLLRSWYDETDERTLGDAGVGVTTWIVVSVGGRDVRVHADTTRDAVRRYLELVAERGPGLPWLIRQGQKGTLNKVWIEATGATKGLFLYTAEVLAEPLDI
jgi:hypothetical protein